MRWFGVSLGEGNTKVGEVLTFSLPSQKTCPGSSKWCRKHCYAHRYEVRRPACRNAYEANLELTQDSEEFAKRMIGVLPRIMPCMRIHVSGDFDSPEYVKAWYRIASAFPKTEFWAYTRSWVVPNIREALEALRQLPNFQLFASTDRTMPLPPEGWRVAFLEDDRRARGMLCKAQTGEEESCLSCGYCFRVKKGNVVFKIH